MVYLLIRKMHRAQYEVNPSAGVTRKDKKKKKKNKNKELDSLKHEIEMDEHRISLEELYNKLGTDPNSGCPPSKPKQIMERDGPNQLTPPKTYPSG
ncbi:hypothetical protein C0Q70_12760 [Pomacea canaliculata]|uniref:Cation-transporting P-type ATPase N-terminal domain-containing protein n=1 Tax=Pomacea canaliculata TaxID=400727 RepID=A0A2T7P2F1_POMCA|nr:hypothetical protein C0Q70_12760 [Pomacea canaliculata]